MGERNGDFVPMPVTPVGTRPERHLYTLDVLRGLGALIVVLYHWGHFFVRQTYAPERMPLYGLLKPFYLNGWEAVDLFFCLSGFVFFWLYTDAIHERRLAAAKFAILRFSRLYPLHLATLLFVAAGQLAIRAQFNHDFIYYENDLYHFILQLFLAGNWGFERGFSFNGPSWSVSVEVLLYAVFFLVCWLRLDRTACLVGFAVAGFLIHMLPGLGPVEVGGGLFCFFIGGLSFRLFRWARAREFSGKFLLVAAALIAVAWFFLPFDHHRLFFYRHYAASPLPAFLTWHGHDAGAYAILLFSGNSINLILFPLTLLVLALLESQGFISGRRLAFIGDLSYSSYLLHFPLQMVFYFVTRSAGVPETWFYTAPSFLLYFGLLIPLSLASHYYFERPVQSLLRRKLLGPA